MKWYSESAKNVKPPGNCLETKNQQEIDLNTLQATSKVPSKHIPSEQPLHLLNNCNYIHIQSTDLCTWKLACSATS